MPTQHIVGVVDRSGSMHGKELDTVGGINAMLTEVKKNKMDDDNIFVSLKLFDHEEQLKWNCVPLDQISDFKETEFVPRGQTALNDALGNTLSHFMEKKLMDPNAYDMCLVYVATDGCENASKHYTREKIKQLIESAKENYAITVLYLGANQDAIKEAHLMGINAERAINYAENSSATDAVYRSVGRMASANRNDPTENVEFTLPERQASQASDPVNIPVAPVIRRMSHHDSIV